MIPQGLDKMTPGPELAAALAGLDWGELSEFDQIVAVKACQRMISWGQSLFYEGLAAVHQTISDLEVKDDEDLDFAFGCTVSELAAALHLTSRAAHTELGFALELKDRLTRVAGMLRTGALDVRRAWVFYFGTGHLPDEIAAEVVDQIAERAAGLTGGQLRALLRKLCLEANPDDAAQRYETALDGRRLVAEGTDAGTVNLFGFDLAPHRVESALGIINRLAEGISDGRSMDQLRADLLLDLLEGKLDPTQARRTGGVELTIDLATLAGLADHAGELAGYGPIIAGLARRVAQEQVDLPWRYTLTHPDSRQPVETGAIRKRPGISFHPDRETRTDSRRPTVGIRRQIIARHRRCVFPGCRMPAAECDLDHRIPWSETGPTSVENLAPLCPRHNRRRQKTGWTYQPLPDGDYQWTAPSGHQYTSSGRPP